MRFQAAWSLVKLATVEKFTEEIMPNFILIVLTVQVRSFSQLIFWFGPTANILRP